VLDESDEIRVGAAAAFSEGNETTFGKIAWLSRKESAKAYVSMVVYLTKGTDARRLLAVGFFHAGGESGVTKPLNIDHGRHNATTAKRSYRT
jgi:hypothetical protein